MMKSTDSNHLSKLFKNMQTIKNYSITCLCKSGKGTGASRQIPQAMQNFAEPFIYRVTQSSCRVCNLRNTSTKQYCRSDTSWSPKACFLSHYSAPKRRKKTFQRCARDVVIYIAQPQSWSGLWCSQLQYDSQHCRDWKNHLPCAIPSFRGGAKATVKFLWCLIVESSIIFNSCTKV